MPRKNTIRQFMTGGYYHIYNRGLNKQKIFLENNDYVFWLHLFKKYLSKNPDKLIENVIADKIILMAYCLMPNHYHLLVKQKDSKSIAKLMKFLNNSYVSYFNAKYNHAGSIFQGVYRAVLITRDEYLLHLTRYIHQNPSSIGKDSFKWEYSSLDYYLGEKKSNWLNPKFVMSILGNGEAYEAFVKDYEPKEHSRIINDFILEED